MKSIVYIFFISIGILVAQEKSEPIVVTGDSLIGRTEDGIKYRDVVGNVIMTQDDVRITCNKIIQNLTENNAELIGNVIVKQDTITIISEKGFYYGNEKYIYSDTLLSLDDGHVVLTADTGYYYFDLKKSIFNSNVQLVDTNSLLKSNKLTYFNNIQKAVATRKVSIENDETTIYCDSLIYYKEHQISKAFNNIKIINPAQRLTITGEKLYDEGENNYTRIIGNPLLTKIDSSDSGKDDTLYIKAKIFEAIEDSSSRLYAIDSVKIIRDDLFSVNSYSVLYKDENRLMTKKTKDDKSSPILWFTTSQLVGDSINIFMNNNKLDSIQIRNDATILSKNENYEFRFDQISGDAIDLYFKNGGLYKTFVNGEVLSIYFMYEKGEPNGVMKSSSNKAIMKFEENEVVGVSMYESVESEFHPENLVDGNELDFTIPSFIIHNNKPKRKDIIKRNK